MLRCLTLALLALTSAAFADDAFWSTVGTAGALGKSKDIRMESEVVRIRLKKHSMLVSASFDLRNDSEAQNVTMAFPDAIEDSKGRTGSSKFAIKWFRSQVDGHGVSTVRKVLDRPASPGTYSAVWLKKVHFGRHALRHVVCTYESAYGEGEDVVTAYYVLRSGATWKGNIGDAKIYVDWSGLKVPVAPRFTLSKSALYTFSALHEAGFPSDKESDFERMDIEANPKLLGSQRAMFEFKVFKPTQDFVMSWPNEFPNFFVNGEEPRGSFEDDSGTLALKGPAIDPSIEFWKISELLGSLKDVQASSGLTDAETKDFELHHRHIRFPDSRHISIDGQSKLLKRPISSQWLHIRDLVSALGGTYKYDKRLGREDINIKW